METPPPAPELPHVLVVDDEPQNGVLLSRYLQMQGYHVICARDGEDGIRRVRERRPDMVLLDISMPGIDGLTVCKRLRDAVSTRSLPIIMITGKSTLENRRESFRSGADDYICKPFDLEEVKIRLEGALSRRQWSLWANPLTRLPGSPAIEEEVRRRVNAGAPFAFSYIDIDSFKAYNDVYGYDAGDHVIRALANYLQEAASQESSGSVFVGHVGGDDFVMMGPPSALRSALPAVLERFDEARSGFYRPADLAQGGIETADRMGRLQRFPLVALTVAVVSSETRTLRHYGRLVGIASELKCYLKKQDHHGKSLLLWDRRQDVPPAPSSPPSNPS